MHGKPDEMRSESAELGEPKGVGALLIKHLKKQLGARPKYRGIRHAKNMETRAGSYQALRAVYEMAYRGGGIPKSARYPPGIEIVQDYYNEKQED